MRDRAVGERGVRRLARRCVSCLAWCSVGLSLAAGSAAIAAGPRAAADDDDGAAAAGPAIGDGRLDAIDPAAVIGGHSTCPRADAVWAAVRTLVPHDRLEERARDLLPSAPPVEIVDLGLPYRVIAGGRVREYRDEARDCAHRARVAAVFVALALDPASYAAAPAPAAPTPTPPPEVVSTTTAAPVVDAAPATFAARLDLAAAVQLGAAADPPALAGLALRFTAGRGALAFVAGASALAPTDTAVGGLAVRLLRLPADAGVRARLHAGRVEISGDLGLAVALLSARALDLAAPASRTTVELGARAAVALRFSRASRLAPFVTVHAEVVPRPSALYALPRGEVGHTPALWIGAAAGASLGL